MIANHSTNVAKPRLAASAPENPVALNSDGHAVFAVKYVEDTLPPADFAELQRLVRAGELTRSQTGPWLQERDCKISNGMVAELRAAINNGSVKTKGKVENASEQLHAAGWNGDSGSHVLFEGVVLKFAEFQHDNIPKPDAGKETEMEKWTETLNAMGKAVRIMRELKACDRADRARATRKKTAEEERADASEAGPELVARMERILNL